MKKQIDCSLITEEVAKACIKACRYLPLEVKKCFKDNLEKEKSPLGKEILEELIKNYEISENDDIPLCQDCGYTVVNIELGQDVEITGGYLYDAINEGVRKGYIEGVLRKSIVDDPVFKRKNTGDNTPSAITTEIVPGNTLKIKIAPKGGGSENMSTLAMLKPAQGVEGVKNFVLESVEKAGSNPCPPIIVGVGIGGTSDKAMYLAKKAALRRLGTKNPDPDYAELEKTLLELVNKTGIGPQGFGGTTTALAVHVEKLPAHIASMPVAVNIQCHSARIEEIFF